MYIVFIVNVANQNEMLSIGKLNKFAGGVTMYARHQIMSLKIQSACDGLSAMSLPLMLGLPVQCLTILGRTYVALSLLRLVCIIIQNLL